MDIYKEAGAKFKPLVDKYGFVPELHALNLHVMNNYVRAQSMQVAEERTPLNYKGLMTVHRALFDEDQMRQSTITELLMLWRYSRNQLPGY